MEYNDGKRLERIDEVVDMGSVRYADKAALVYKDRVISYCELSDISDYASISLRNMGVHKDDRVGILLPNCTSFPPVYFGILKTGAVAVPLNLSRDDRSLEYIIEDADIDHIITNKDLLERAKDLISSSDIDSAIAVGFGEDLPDSEVDALDLSEFNTETESPTSNGGPDDIAVQLYTSGTTGEPKGVRLTHGNLLSSVESVAGECVPIDPDDTLLLVLPLFHIYALNSLMCTSLYSGGEIKILEEPNPKRIITNLMHENIDIFAGVPSMYRMIYDQYKENAGEPNLKYAICAGAPLSEDTRSNIVEDMGINMVKGWGMTEASTGTMEPVRGLKKGPGCVGLPLPGIDIKIVDPEDHSSIRVSSSNLSPYGVESKHIEGLDEDQRTGEVALRGPQVFEGYHKLPEKNDEVFDGEGWFYTGDILQVDKDGYFWMVDRADDMIIVGGENVYPTEVENALHEHPDVAEATVVGVPHEVKGEAPVAFVVLKEGTERAKDLTEKELRKFSLEHTAKYAHPRKIFFVNELPHSATGKVEKYKLEEKAEERIGTLGSSEKL